MGVDVQTIRPGDGKLFPKTVHAYCHPSCRPAVYILLPFTLPLPTCYFNSEFQNPVMHASSQNTHTCTCTESNTHKRTLSHLLWLFGQVQGQKLEMHYVGTLASNGQEFDSSYARNKPFRFTIGVGQVVILATRTFGSGDFVDEIET